MIYRMAMGLLGGGLRLAAPLAGPGLRERLALDGPDAAPGAIWLHGASMGELASARPIAEALAARHPVIVTANSTTGRDFAGDWGLPAMLAPLDAPAVLRRFITRHRPALAITIEAEIWPNRAALLAGAGIPQAMIGARLSPRSLARWRRMPGLIGPVLGRMALLSPRNEAAGAQFLALGLPDQALTDPVNLKLVGPRGVVPPAPSAQRDRTVLIASSHADEEPMLLAGLARLRARAPDLRIIWAPRHPARFDPLARALPDFARRSKGADGEAQFLLADSMGEMGRWYRLAGTVLLAGSFGGAGGHSPWEAAGHGCAILHGPAIASAAWDYAMLDKAGAAMTVDAQGWPARLAELVDDPARARTMGRAARAVLEAQSGDPAPLIAALLDLAGRPEKTDIRDMTGDKQ